MPFLSDIKAQIARQINEYLGGEYAAPSDFVRPDNPDFGDLSLGCFGLARRLGRPPVDLAAALASDWPAESPVASGQAVGPYVNFQLSTVEMAAGVLEEIYTQKDLYGENVREGGRRVVVEYSNVNTHKDYHIGHLRNLAYGDAVQRILTAAGDTVFPVSYVNDFGGHTAKTLWGLRLFAQGPGPAVDKGYWLGQVYARAAAAAKEDPAAPAAISRLMKEIESRQGESYKQWQKTRQWSIDGFTAIYQELGVNFAQIFYESEFFGIGKALVARLLAAGQLQESAGAVIADLGGDGLGVLVFIRSDGTALYPVSDLPLALEKRKLFQPDKSFLVVDERQSLYFRQLNRLLAALGEEQAAITHLPYAVVKLPEGMMSSRSGNVISYHDLRNQVLEKAKTETSARHPDWPAEKIDNISWALAKGALKFEMVKVGAGQVITFDSRQALRFDGFTAAYLQYTCARIRSVLRKAAGEEIAQEYCQRPDELSPGWPGNLREVREHRLLFSLASYPETVQAAAQACDPSLLAKQIFALAKDFNDYYHAIPVLKAETAVREARLRLLGAVRQVIGNGLGLLGIDGLDEM